MGLYADGADPRLVLDSDVLAQVMRPAVEAWFDAHIRIVDPESQTVTPYDPITDTGGEATEAIVWDSGERGALVQPLRAQTIGDFGGQAIGLVAVRIQAFIPPGIALRAGLHLRVIDGGSDTESTRYTYVLGSGIDSSLRWATRLTAMVVST